MDAAALFNLILVPFVAAAAVGLVLRWMRLSPRPTWAVAVALGFIAGQLGLRSRAGWHVAFQSLIGPIEARDWLPMCLLVAAGVAVLSSFASVPQRRWVLALAAAVCVAVPLRLVASNVRLAEAWSVPQKLGCIALLAATLGLVWLVLELTRDDDQPLVRLILLVVVVLGSAVVITLSGTIVGGQLCAVLASALIGTAFGRWVAERATATAGPPLDGFGGIGPVVTMSVGGLIVLASFYAELAPLDAGLLFLSLIAAAGPLSATAWSGPGWFQAAIRAALALCPITIAIVRNLPA